MFCPSCSAENSIEQKFCRSCGMNLENTALSLQEQFPSTGRVDIQRQERMLERFGQVAFTGFGVAVLTGVGAFIFWVLTGANFWTGLFLIGFLIFAGLTLAYVVMTEMLKDKKAVRPAGGAREVPAADTQRLLHPTSFEPPGSVAENTTELLESKSPARKI